MKKTLLFSCLFCFALQTSWAQSANISELYVTYQIDRTDDSKAAKTKATAFELLKRSSELTKNQVANLNFSLGHAFESEGQMASAVPYYENVIKLVPGYYVPYRALAYYNLKKCDTLGKKIAESVRLKDAVMTKFAIQNYNAQAVKTIAYFEKALACDADDDTSKTILESLYKSIKQPELLGTLPDRLKKLGTECITLLDD